MFLFISVCRSFRPLPLEKAFNRHTDLNGQLSRAVTTVVPQNPFNQMANPTGTVNASLDSRAHALIPSLPRSTSSPPKDTTTNEKKEERTDQRPVKL